MVSHRDVGQHKRNSGMYEDKIKQHVSTGGSVCILDERLSPQHDCRTEEHLAIMSDFKGKTRPSDSIIDGLS
jgi:hypothetical protein